VSERQVSLFLGQNLLSGAQDGFGAGMNMINA
jgi:hypothetical protein